jgi:acetolactate synthase-1/2/3 large subunit
MSPDQSAGGAVKASDLFIRALENEGVEFVFGVPGEENLDLLESLRSSSIEFVLTRHEQGAGFMASTYGRLTGAPGVCLSTLGPGATNLVTAAAYAKLGAMPMVMVTGQKPVKTSKQGRFQIVDIVRLMEPVTKYARQIVDASLIPSIIRDAFRIAREERPGPVLLELPEDVAAETCEMTELIPPNLPRYPEAGPGPIQDAVTMIRSARHPLLLVGAGANRNRIVDALTRFVDVTRIPFFNTQMGKGVICDQPDLYLGTAALSEGDFLHCAIAAADLVINAGHDVIEKPPFFMEHGGMKVIHVNFTSAEVDAVYFPQMELVGDVASSFDRLTDALGGPCPGHDFTYFMKVRNRVHDHMQKGAEDPRFPPIPQRVVADVRHALPDDGVLTLDNGMYKIWFARNYRTRRPNTVLLDNALATMGAGLPSAMTAALVHPGRRVMAVCGDGGFMMNSQELETAVRMGLDLIVLVLNDGSYGMIRWKQAIEDFPDWGLEFGNPDFVAYAEAYGAHGHRISETDELRPLMESCLRDGGTHVIDVPVDYGENQRVLIDELRSLTCDLEERGESAP